MPRCEMVKVSKVMSVLNKGGENKCLTMSLRDCFKSLKWFTKCVQGLICQEWYKHSPFRRQQELPDKGSASLTAIPPSLLELLPPLRDLRIVASFCVSVSMVIMLQDGLSLCWSIGSSEHLFRKVLIFTTQQVDNLGLSFAFQ